MISQDENQRSCWDGWFCATLPSGWTHDQSEGVINIYHPDGVGAISVSMFFDTEGVSDASLNLALRFAAQKKVPESRVRVLSLRAGGSEIEFCEPDPKPRYWRVAAFHRAKQAIIMSYNSAVEDRAHDADAVDDIFQSFEWEPRA